MSRTRGAPRVEVGIADAATEFDAALLRAQPVLDAMRPAAAVALLIGEAGSGKRYLAEHVAGMLERSTDGAVRALLFQHAPSGSDEPEQIFGAVLPEAFHSADSEELGWLSETFRAAKVAERLAAAARESTGSTEPLFVLPGVDRYSPRSIAVLEHLIRRQEVRIIATARRMTGGASQMGRDPRVSRIAVGPLDLREADILMSSMLGNARLSPATLHRWHAVTGGNSHALTLMLLANARSGALGHRQGVARVAPGRDEIPEELMGEIEESCSPAEQAALELIALAEPLVEPALIRLLDVHTTNALLDRNLISSSVVDGRPALGITRPILAVALRARMSPSRRIALADSFFLALTGGSSDDEFAKTSPHLMRAVDFGLESGRRLPHDWLARAASTQGAEADPRLMLRVSLALASEYTSEEAAAAAIRAVSYSMQLGDTAATETAHRRLEEMLLLPTFYFDLPAALRTCMQLSQIERRFRRGASMREILERLDEIETALEEGDSGSRVAVRSLRFQLLVRDGEFSAANEAFDEPGASDDIVTELMRAPARSTSALLLYQQGRLQSGLQLAHRARSLSTVGNRPLNDTAELQSFQWFLGYWASGSADGARRALEDMEAAANSGRYAETQLFFELIEAGWALLALLEARWRDAADLVELMFESTLANDPHGLVPLLHAVHALALAALGERKDAMEALLRAKEERRGVSQAIAGFRRRIIVHAQQWLRLGDPAAEALDLAAWARSHRLDLIELQALHVAAVESVALARQSRERARELAATVDPLIAEVILAHIEKIADGASPTDVSEPEVRLLADLGLWIPLPKSTTLTPREREIALLASLGYASRFIAERFHLSDRTVETHLAHVYTKLGISDRAELRWWFSVDHRAG